MADGGRNLRINPFIVEDDHLATGERWEDWIEELEREMRFFKVRTADDKRDALLIFGGPEIRRLDKCLPETEESNSYINLKTKLANYFAPKKNIHYARYVFLKTVPLAGESILAFALRLRDKAKSCGFSGNYDERILEQIIQTTENKDLIRNIIRNKWSLEQTLTEMQIIEETEEQVRAMSRRSTADVAQINRIRFYKDINVKNQNKNSTCKYCGKNHPWRKYLCPSYGKKCIKCGKFNHFAAVCKSNTMLRNQQRNRVDICRNVYRIPENSERSNSHELEDDIFIGDSIFHPKGLQNSSSQIKKVFDTSQSLITSNRSKRQCSYSQISEENKSNEIIMTKPKSGQFVNKECVHDSSAMQMQITQAKEMIHKQSKKQEEILCHQMNTKEEIENLQSNIFQRDKLLNNLDSKLTTLSTEHDNLKENYEQLFQTLNNQLIEGINKEVQLRNEIKELKNAHEAELREINEIFKRQIQELQTELDSAKVGSLNFNIREDDEETVDLDDVEVHAPGMVFEQNNKDKYKSRYNMERNVHRMFDNTEQLNSNEQEDDPFIGDSIRHLQELQISSAQKNGVNGSAIDARRHTDDRVVYRDASKFKQVPADTAARDMNDWRGRVMGAIPDQSVEDPTNAPELNITPNYNNDLERRIQHQRDRPLPERYRDYLIDFEQ